MTNTKETKGDAVTTTTTTTTTEKPTEPSAVTALPESLSFSEQNRESTTEKETSYTTPAMIPVYRPPSIEKEFLFPAEAKKNPAMMDLAFLCEEKSNNHLGNHPLPPRTSWNRVLRLQQWIQESKVHGEQPLDGLLFVCGTSHHHRRGDPEADL